MCCFNHRDKRFSCVWEKICNNRSLKRHHLSCCAVSLKLKTFSFFFTHQWAPAVHTSQSRSKPPNGVSCEWNCSIFARVVIRPPPPRDHAPERTCIEAVCFFALNAHYDVIWNETFLPNVSRVRYFELQSEPLLLFWSGLRAHASCAKHVNHHREFEVDCDVSAGHKSAFLSRVSCRTTV